MMGLNEETIEMKANELRAKLNLDAVLAPCMYTVLEKCQQRSSRFTFRAAYSTEVGAFEAMMDDETHTLVLREWVLEEVKAGRERSRFTVAHELGHYVLGHKGLRQRTQSQAAYPSPKSRIEEGEADLFASYFLVPSALAWSIERAEDISEKFQVSGRVSEIAYERIQRAKRKVSGQKRPLPSCVVDFLKEAELRGRKIRSDISE